MRDYLSDDEIAKLDPATRYRFLTSRHLALEHSAAVLSAALFSRLCRDGQRDLAYRIVRLLDDTAHDPDLGAESPKLPMPQDHDD
jgi:hypothetical protein